MVISLVAAAADNNVIGKNNTLPWRMPADMKFFMNLTMGHTVVMGRKTYESMGRPLPKRKNVVITRNKDFKAEGCIVVSSLQEMKELCKEDGEVFIIGGAEIYKLSMKLADKIYLTRIHGDFEGDAHFPEIHADIWAETSKTGYLADEKNPYPYTFLVYSRIK